MYLHIINEKNLSSVSGISCCLQFLSNYSWFFFSQNAKKLEVYHIKPSWQVFSPLGRVLRGGDNTNYEVSKFWPWFKPQLPFLKLARYQWTNDATNIIQKVILSTWPQESWFLFITPTILLCSLYLAQTSVFCAVFCGQRFGSFLYSFS